MKPAQEFLEQVLAGLLAIAVFVVPFASREDLSIWTGSLTAGGALVAGAFLIGTIFDRLADSALSTLEQSSRLRRAVANEKRGLLAPGWGDDRFPEDLLRVDALKLGGAVCAYVEWLRTRVRVARSVAFYAPGLAVSLGMSPLWPTGNQHESVPKLVVLGLVCVAYGVDTTVAYRSGKLLKDMKTYTPNLEEELGTVDLRLSSAVWVRATIASAVFTLLFGYTQAAADGAHLLRGMIALTGCAFTALALWAWTRILNTYQEALVSIAWHAEPTRRRSVPEDSAPPPEQ